MGETEDQVRSVSGGQGQGDEYRVRPPSGVRSPLVLKEVLGGLRVPHQPGPVLLEDFDVPGRVGVGAGHLQGTTRFLPQGHSARSPRQQVVTGVYGNECLCV